MPPQYQTPYEPEIPREHHKPAQNPWIVPFSIIVAGALIGAGIYFSKTAPPAIQVAGSNTKATAIGEIVIKPITASDHILGNPNAPVKIIEFSDPECPFCKQFHVTMHQIMDQYGKNGQVAWVYRQFPIPSLHKRAPNEVEAMECANELGGNTKFWAFTDLIFSRTQSNDSFDPAQLPVIAKDVGLDVNQFNTCLSANKYVNLIASQSRDGVGAGAQGTPFSVLIGPTGEKVAISGAQPYDVVKSLVDAALSQIPAGNNSVSGASQNTQPSY